MSRAPLIRASLGIGASDPRYYPRSPSEAKGLGLGFVPEERPQAIFEDMSVRENISSASGDRITNLGIVQRSRERIMTMSIFAKLDVRAPSVDVPLRSLSGGNQQKVVLGRWLMRESQILILDDPTSGVDIGAKHEIYRLIVEQTCAGASVIMSSSELPELLAIANRILVLHRGRVAGLVEGERMNQREVLHLAVRGIAADGPDAAGHPSLSADVSPGSAHPDDNAIP